MSHGSSALFIIRTLSKAENVLTWNSGCDNFSSTGSVLIQLKETRILFCCLTATTIPSNQTVFGDNLIEYVISSYLIGWLSASLVFLLCKYESAYYLHSSKEISGC